MHHAVGAARAVLAANASPMNSLLWTTTTGDYTPATSYTATTLR